MVRPASLQSKRKLLQRKTRHSNGLPFKIQNVTYLLFIVLFLSILYSYYHFLNSSFPTSKDSQRKQPLIRNNNNLQLSTTSQTNNAIQNKASSSRTNPTIAYVISITACPSDNTLLDAAAVLAHSITLSQSSYDHQMYAIVHPTAETCSKVLQSVGYKILVRDIPVPVSEIRGDILRKNVVNNGCCGANEFIKLWAYTLVDHAVAVHLDTDVLILKKMDVLFDVMLGKRHQTDDVPVAFNKPLPDKVDAFFTRDYNMVRNREHVGVQGGFLVLRPEMRVFEDFKDIIREGDYREGRPGWGGKGYGTFYGSMTFQGIVPYYYDMKPRSKDVEAVELDRCYYNNMADNPMTEKTVNDVLHGKCRDGRKECEDCRRTNLDEIVTVHFTLCQKPWLCMDHSLDQVQHRLCRKLHHEWYKVRANLEDEVWHRQRTGANFGQYDPQHFLGFCSGRLSRGYMRMEAPHISRA